MISVVYYVMPLKEEAHLILKSQKAETSSDYAWIVHFCLFSWSANWSITAVQAQMVTPSL